MNNNNEEKVNEYSSNRWFKVFDFHTSYEHFLIRSEKGTRDGYANNVDLIFFAVQFISIPTSFDGIKITNPCNKKAIEIEKKYALKPNKGKFVFFLESETKKHFIIASSLAIDEHNLNVNESSLDYVCEMSKCQYYVEDWF